MTTHAARIAEVAALLRDAESLLFITGAGLSADSGLPTYRGIGGLYNDADPESGLPIEELLSGRAFRRDPAAGTTSSPRWSVTSPACGYSPKTSMASTGWPARGTSSTFTATCTTFAAPPATTTPRPATTPR
ncbi:MAG: hypothetical protein MUF18_15700 [Fimbriiglobus sp.]|nr:hypothetical protein [Fimbriiglobus sp.]